MKNCNRFGLNSLLFVFMLNSVACLKESDQYSLKYFDECDLICKNNYFKLSHKLYNELSICQRGCRFFRIAGYTDGVNVTKLVCNFSCDSSYRSAEENKICKIGCDLRAKNGLSNIYDENNVSLFGPNMDFLESDEVLRYEVVHGYYYQYKIPEAYVKTAPARKGKLHNKNDWLDCASKSSGIPRWVLLSAILSAILIALFLSLSADRQQEEAERNKDDKCCLIKDKVESKTSVLDTAPHNYKV